MDELIAGLACGVNPLSPMSRRLSARVGREYDSATRSEPDCQASSAEFQGLGLTGAEMLQKTCCAGGSLL